MHQKSDLTTICANWRTFVDKETNALDCEIEDKKTLIDFRKTIYLNKKFFVVINDNVACNSVAKDFRKAIYFDEDFYIKVEKKMTTTNFLFENITRDEVLIEAKFFCDVNNRLDREVEL